MEDRELNYMCLFSCGKMFPFVRVYYVFRAGLIQLNTFSAMTLIEKACVCSCLMVLWKIYNCYVSLLFMVELRLNLLYYLISYRS